MIVGSKRESHLKKYSVYCEVHRSKYATYVPSNLQMAAPFLWGKTKWEFIPHPPSFSCKIAY